MQCNTQHCKRVRWAGQGSERRAEENGRSLTIHFIIGSPFQLNISKFDADLQLKPHLTLTKMVFGRVDAEARWSSRAPTQDRGSPVLQKEQIGRGCKNEILPNAPVSVLFADRYKCLASCFLTWRCADSDHRQKQDAVLLSYTHKNLI